MVLRWLLRLAFGLHFIVATVLVVKFIQLKANLDIFSLKSDVEDDVDFSSNTSRLKFSKILVVTYLRSGSTFLADLLQQNPETFYTFEPLNYLGTKVSRVYENMTDASYKILKEMFECDREVFYAMQKKFAKSSRFRIAKFYHKLCDKNSTICDKPDVLRLACEETKVRVLKVVRLNLRQLYKMFKKHPEMPKEVKIVHSRRDPRGMFNSRRTRPWCQNGTECGSIEKMCSEMREDLVYYAKLSQEYPDNFVEVRFEDLAFDSYSRAKLLYHQIGLPWTSEAKNFVTRHTKVGHDTKLSRHPYSTFRNSKSVPYAWVTQLKWDTVEFIQRECADVMSSLGYKKITKKFLTSTDDFDLEHVIDFDY